MDAERVAELRRRGALRDQRVARHGAEALAQAVDRNRRRHARPPAARRQKAQPAKGGHGVAQAGQCFRLTPSIHGHAARQAGQRADAVVKAVQRAEGQRRKAELHDQVQRQHAGHHLR